MENRQYLSHDTIFALATPVGGALSIVRISGPEALPLLSELLGPPGVNGKEVREIFRARLFSGDELIDDSMAVFYRTPKSQTGEDLVELFLHGGSIVAERVLATLSLKRARQALPGEFSFRAVRNGKMSITEAQAVADLISATNEGAAQLALEKMEGTQGRLISELAEKLRSLSTMGELGIDFADQDVEELSLRALKVRLGEILNRLRVLESSFDRGNKIQTGVRAVFIGRPNAGKSSFFNALLGEERSIVSDQAGTTRDVVRESMTLRNKKNAVTLRFEDTAGIREFTSDEIEREGMDRSIRAARDADLVLFVIDLDGGAEALTASESVWASIGRPTENTVAILTKTDRATDPERDKMIRALEKSGIGTHYFVSSVTGEGVSEAARGIVDFCQRFTHRSPGEVLLTRLDHLRAVQDTITHLERALDSTEEDLFAADLRQALVALGPVIGETLPDDILGRIFSEFCIGK